MMATIKKIALGLLPICGLATCSFVSSMPPNSQSLFNESMKWMDMFYDPPAGYLYDFSAATALRHGTRSSAWYSFGLLARNRDNDVEEACKIIKNVISGQFKDPKDQWFATYQKYPEEAVVGSTNYPADIYDTWDPNWRGFVGTTFVMALEEFGHLIPDDVTKLMEESLFNATVGDTYRVGGVDDDNLYPAYTNPSLMRAFVSGWTGRRLNDSNMTVSGENYANEIITPFNRSNTLSEFNSGTYTGVSLYAMTLWAKYLPADSVMTQMGPKMIQNTWEAVAELWHPDLKNVAGPWDRSYGFDMNRYLSLLALELWVLIGKDKSSIIEYAPAMSHSADFAYGPLMAVLGEFHNSLVPAAVVDKLVKFQGEHTFNSSTFSPPFDTYPRNITAWLADRITIGSESFDENVLGGPAENPATFRPALIQWDTGKEVSFIAWQATENALTAVSSAGKLDLSYPHGNSTSIFSLLVGTFADQRTVESWTDIVGLSVNITGNFDPAYSLTFAGAGGGADSPINDFEFWNFTYSMPSNFSGVPSLSLEVELK